MPDVFEPHDFNEDKDYHDYHANIESKIKNRRDINTRFDEAKLDDLASRKNLRYWVSGAVGLIYEESCRRNFNFNETELC